MKILLALALATGTLACGGRTDLSLDAGVGGGTAWQAIAGNGGTNAVIRGAGGADASSGGRATAATGGLAVGGSPRNGTDPITTCAQYDNFTVGSYIIETDYWNQSGCPGTQCMTIDPVKGSFTVTQGPNCGDTVASYPNVLYGTSFGATSPGSELPRQMSSLNAVTSSWDFAVGGTSTDHYDVAYDIWFCTNNSCGSSGFPGGLELMIWLDYQNTHGWQFDLGSVTLSGYTWEVWTFTQGSGANTWTYLAYMIQPTMLTSVANLDLMAFFTDAENRGYLQNSWYLYAIQAGIEMRSGGVPYYNYDFSVSVN